MISGLLLNLKPMRLKEIPGAYEENNYYSLGGDDHNDLDEDEAE